MFLIGEWVYDDLKPYILCPPIPKTPLHYLDFKLKVQLDFKMTRPNLGSLYTMRRHLEICLVNYFSRERTLCQACFAGQFFWPLSDKMRQAANSSKNLLPWQLPWPTFGSSLRTLRVVLGESYGTQIFDAKHVI